MRVLRWLIWLQILAGIGAVVAAGIDIESILVSGACTATLGLAITRLAFRSGRLWGVVFGIAGPTVAVVVWTSILYQRWGPNDAQRPVFVFLVCVLPVLWLLAGLALREKAVAWPQAPHRRRYQFTVGTLLAATLWIAAPLAGYRSVGGGQRGLAVAILAAHLVFVGLVFWRFFRRSQLERNRMAMS